LELLFTYFQIVSLCILSRNIDLGYIREENTLGLNPISYGGENAFDAVVQMVM